MALSAAVPNPVVVQPESAALRFVARQPILNLHGAVHGYELLFRAGPEAAFRGDGNLATRTMLDNTILFGLEQLAGNHPAFVNCTADSLTSELVDVLPPSLTVLEILETVEPTPQLIESCRKLKVSGFRFALDDFVWEPRFEPFVDLADYIKVDFRTTSPDERHTLLRRLSDRPIHMLAEKVETQQEYEQARCEGFTLFQGYYFCRPTLFKNRKVPSNRIFQFKLMKALQHSPLELAEITRLVTRDAALSYRLLRLVNSPAYGFRQEIRSIQSALIAVGEDTFRRVATLALASDFNEGQPAEILHMALMRGRFCAKAAPLCGLDPTEQYLLGMLSLLPAMLRVPMEELAPTLPLRDAIQASLRGEPVRERILLDWLERHERGDWAASDAHAQSCSLDSQKLAAHYEQALVWAETALGGHSSVMG